MSDDITLFTDSSSTTVQPTVQNYANWPFYPTYPSYPVYPTTTTDYTWAWTPPLTKEDIREVLREELRASQKREFKLVALVEEHKMLLSKLNFDSPSVQEDFLHTINEFNQELDRILARDGGDGGDKEEKSPSLNVTNETPPVVIETREGEGEGKEQHGLLLPG